MFRGKALSPAIFGSRGDRAVNGVDKMQRRFKIASVLAAGVAGAVLLIPRSSCACMTPEMLFQFVFKVSPVEAGAIATRRAILKVVPPGTPAAAARAASSGLGTGDDDGALKCASDREAIRCDYELSHSAFGIVRQGVRFAFHLDDQGLVADVTTELTTHVFGGEL